MNADNAKSNVCTIVTDYRYCVTGWTYTGKAARIELWPSQDDRVWGMASTIITKTDKGTHYELAVISRDRILNFKAFDEHDTPVAISCDDLILDKEEPSFMKHWSNEKWDDKINRVGWWRHDRFGLFIHFGLYAAPARHEWLKSSQRMSEEAYSRYFENFNPVRFDAKAWARAAKSAGMKYVVITTKHHEGFCLWDSKYTDYKITNTPFGRDLLREAIDAFRAEGLKIGVYYSLLDWHHPDHTIDKTQPRRPCGAWDPKIMTREVVDKLNEGRDMARYRAYLRNQIGELLTEYGKIDIIWFDGSPGGGLYGQGKTHVDWDSLGLLEYIRSVAPDILVNDRLAINDWEDGFDFMTPEQSRDTEPPQFAGRFYPWEACQTFSGSWGYYRDEKTWKSTFQILEQLILTVSAGGNLIMNVGPTAAGEFDGRALERLADYGEWMRVNGESIYGCGRAPDDIRSTPIPNTLYTYNAATKKLYVHFLAWTLGPVKIPFADKVKYVQFLHDHSEIPVVRGELMIPLDKPPVEIPVVEFSLMS